MSDQYRIEPVRGGFEAQMLCGCGAGADEKWFPLNPDGYWSDPEAYSFGLISNRHVFATREEAARAIARARAINQAPLQPPHEPGAI
jgi:hypothetical protein